MAEAMRFKDYKELRKFLKGPKEFKEPERIGEVKDEVPSERPDQRVAEDDAPEMGESAEDANEG